MDLSADQEKPKNTDALRNKDVIFGHRPCQTRDAKWLCLDNIYQKFYRPNLYDVGGTYIEDVPDFWFTYKTEQCGNIFLLHLFACNRQEGNFLFKMDSSSDLRIDKKNNIVYLAKSLKYFEMTQLPAHCPVYITTYHFSDLDVDFMKGRKLYIGVSLQPISKHECHGDEIKSKHDFKALLTDLIGSDFTIESSDGEKFRVHKIFLCFKSDVFKAMLKEDTAESQNGFVKLVDVPADDLKRILEFIYTGTISDFENCNVVNLLMLADRYNLTGLVELSHCVLKQHLSLDNALEMLALADMYNAEDLKLAAFKFIKKYFGTEGLQTSNIFKEITNTALVKELFEYIYPNGA